MKVLRTVQLAKCVSWTIHRYIHFLRTDEEIRLRTRSKASWQNDPDN